MILDHSRLGKDLYRQKVLISVHPLKGGDIQNGQPRNLKIPSDRIKDDHYSGSFPQKKVQKSDFFDWAGSWTYRHSTISHLTKISLFSASGNKVVVRFKSP